MHWKTARGQREAAIKNSQRTSFRIAEYQRKMEMQRQRREEEEALRVEQEERLRKLRETVAPEVISGLLRACGRRAVHLRDMAGGGEEDGG